MKSKRQTSLIRDLLAIFQKYNEEEITEGIAALRNGDALDGLFRLIEAGTVAFPNARPHRDLRSRQRTNPREQFQNYVEKIAGEQDSADVVEFLEAIARRQALRNTAALREFARLLRMELSGGKLDRHLVAKKIGEALLQHSSVDRRNLIEIASHWDGQHSSLGEWSNLIVKG